MSVTFLSEAMQETTQLFVDDIALRRLEIKDWISVQLFITRQNTT